MPETVAKRVRLDRELIVEAALELARSEPHADITFRRLGEALGVDATAMYRHFRSKTELTRAALDRLRAMTTDYARSVPGTWREQLETHMMRFVEVSLEYPSIGAQAAVIDPVGPGDTGTVEFLLEKLTEAGLEGGALIRAYAALSGFALSHGAALAHEVMVTPGAARDGSTPWISTFGTVRLSDYPMVDAHRDALLAIDGVTVYRAGIAAILDSVERGTVADARSGPAA